MRLTLTFCSQTAYSDSCPKLYSPVEQPGSLWPTIYLQLNPLLLLDTIMISIYSSYSCLLDPPILRMDPWLIIAWANISRVYCVLGSPCLLGIVGTAPYTPLTKYYHTGSDTDAAPVWLGNFIPLHRDNYLIFLRIPPPFGPNLRRERKCTECEVYRK